MYPDNYIIKNLNQGPVILLTHDWYIFFAKDNIW